jgi:lipopolysaccharide transport system permease protein
MLVLRAVRLRYRGAVLGYAWTLMAPLLLMSVYTLVFAVYLGVDVPAYAAFLFSAFIPWTWFASSVQEGTEAMVSGAHLITRSRFDADLLPAVTVLERLVHCVLALPLVIVFAVLSGRPLGSALFALPLLLALQLLLTLGPVTVLSALNVYYRDVQHIVPTVLQVLFFITPILYQPDVIPEPLQFFAALNPWFHLSRAYQHVLYDGTWPSAGDLVVLAGTAVFVHVVCERVFARYRDRLVEEL